ncbi:MAG: diaminopimelate epimerase, partial [Alistipes timonensis]|nr:diaminopimelate epimerase [Alistipes timonensis]
MESLKFTKMHGIGNDYVYIDCTASCPDNIEDLARRVSDRHTGVGGDGLVLILPSEIADFKMRMFNADGSEGRMCGNASRCIGKYAYDRGLTDRENITLETLSGVKYLSLHLGNDGKVESVTVDMGEPEFIPELIPVLADRNLAIPAEADGGEILEVNAVSTGNPHGVVFVDDLDAFGARVHTAGPILETHPMWPERANIEFAQVLSPSEIRMRVWERGSGETMACGTGACATAVAA